MFQQRKGRGLWAKEWKGMGGKWVEENGEGELLPTCVTASLSVTQTNNPKNKKKSAYPRDGIHLQSNNKVQSGAAGCMPSK